MLKAESDIAFAVSTLYRDISWSKIYPWNVLSVRHCKYNLYWNLDRQTLVYIYTVEIMGTFTIVVMPEIFCKDTFMIWFRHSALWIRERCSAKGAGNCRKGVAYMCQCVSKFRCGILVQNKATNSWSKKVRQSKDVLMTNVTSYNSI